MKKYFVALLAISALSFAGEIAPTKNENVTVTPEMKEFKQQYGNALSTKLGVSPVSLGFLNQGDSTALVIQFQGDITLRQARTILIDSVETLKGLIQSQPELESKFPGISQDPTKMSLIIDTYDDTKEKDQQYGVSSIILSKGQVYFMGISHHTGKETLMHKQTYQSAVDVANQQKKPTR